MSITKLCLGIACLCALPWVAQAKSVTSPSELGATDFYTYIESPNGSYPATFQRGPAPVGIDLTDPVLAGNALTGHITLEADTQRTGPTTNLNAVLEYSGPPASTIDVDLAALVTFDLALFGPAGGPAAVRILGNGIGGVSGREFTPTGSVTGSVSGYVTIYETDAAGNVLVNSNTLTWYVPGNFTSTPIDEVIQLNRNELYKVIVRSTGNIGATNVEAFNLSAYMIVDPTFTSETPGVQAFVSQGAAPVVPLPGAAWLLGSGLLALAGWRRRMAA